MTKEFQYLMRLMQAASRGTEVPLPEEEIENIAPKAAGLIVTPREIDLLIARAARLLAAGINRALQPDYDPLELISLALG